jgi:putative SOS response-associated peptidase YedK
MCGRFALTKSPRDLEDVFATAIPDFPPLYNIAPTQPILMVMTGERRRAGSNQPERNALLVRWGFIPAWAKDPRSLPLLFNARSETAAEKGTFRAAMRHRRALVPASGFYEWKREGKNKVQAYWVRPRNGSLIAFAGLMETWHEPGGSEIDTGTILTTAANSDIAHIHERMPVVIAEQDFPRWLDCLNREPRDVADLLVGAEPGFFEAIPVSDRVNKVANAGPGLQQRVEPAERAAPERKETPAEGNQLRLL